jgi:hypothetical protein
MKLFIENKICPQIHFLFNISYSPLLIVVIIS